MKAGDTVLMQAGASGLASVLIPMARAFGARVITTVRDEATARAIESLGADRIVMTDREDLAAVMEEACRDRNDYLRRLADGGRINEAEEKLFDLIENTAWDGRQKAALILSFYDHLNGMDDETLARADFSRDEIVSGLEDAMKAARMEIPEYLRI